MDSPILTNADSEAAKVLQRMRVDSGMTMQAPSKVSSTEDRSRCPATPSENNGKGEFRDSSLQANNGPFPHQARIFASSSHSSSRVSSNDETSEDKDDCDFDPPKSSAPSPDTCGERDTLRVTRNSLASTQSSTQEALDDDDYDSGASNASSPSPLSYQRNNSTNTLTKPAAIPQASRTARKTVPKTSTSELPAHQQAASHQSDVLPEGVMIAQFFQYFNRMTQEQKMKTIAEMRKVVKSGQSDDMSRRNDGVNLALAGINNHASEIVENPWTPVIGNKRKPSELTPQDSKRPKSGGSFAIFSSKPLESNMDSQNTVLRRVTRTKRPRDSRTHSEAIQDTKCLFERPEEVGLPSYTPVAGILKRYPNPSTDTSQFFTGRYLDLENGTRFDQQTKLVMKIVHPDPSKPAKVIWHHVPKDWNDPHTITVLNRWRSQAIKRHTGMKQREKIVRYDYAEREFIRDIVIGDQQFKNGSQKERPAILTKRLNEKFGGVSLSGDQLDAYRQAKNDEERKKIRPSKKRGLRSKASVASEYSRHAEDYHNGRIPERRLTGWTIDNQDSGDEAENQPKVSMMTNVDASSTVNASTTEGDGSFVLVGTNGANNEEDQAMSD